MRERTPVDRDARRKIAELLRSALAGQITNMELDERFPERSKDPAVHAVYCQTWRYQDDFKEYRLTGDFKPPEEVRRRLERCALFMEGDLPYEWPSPIGYVLEWIRSLVGQPNATRGDRSVWPFFRRSDFDTINRTAPSTRSESGPGHH